MESTQQETGEKLLKENDANLKNIIKDTAPVFAGYITLGMGFGVMMSVNGYSVGWVALMSLLVFAGSLEYVAVGMLTGGASLLTFAITSLAVNIRHVFYGVSLIDKYKGTGAAKPYLIFGLTDETYALVSSRDRSKKYYLLVTLFDHSYWVLGSTLGAIVGSTIHFNSTGIDFAMTGLFITIVVDQWLDSKDHFAALTGIVVSVLSLVLFGPDRFLVPAMIGIAVILLIKMPRSVSESDETIETATALDPGHDIEQSEEVPHDR